MKLILMTVGLVALCSCKPRQLASFTESTSDSFQSNRLVVTVGNTNDHMIEMPAADNIGWISVSVPKGSEHILSNIIATVVVTFMTNQSGHFNTTNRFFNTTVTKVVGIQFDVGGDHFNHSIWYQRIFDEEVEYRPSWFPVETNWHGNVYKGAHADPNDWKIK